MNLRAWATQAGQRGVEHRLAKRSDGRISLSTAYRLVRQRGRVKMFDGDLLEAMCDVLGLQPGQLLEREPKRRKSA